MASSMEIWEEARRRARNHLRVSLVESGMKANKVAKLNLEKQVNELMSADGGEYLRVAFVRLNVEIMEDEDEPC